jgi:hypothetical protein
VKPLTLDVFDRWMDAYGRASVENDAKASVELFSPGAKYYETPFDEPMVGRKAIYQYWLTGATTLKDKESTYEILSVRDNTGIARWKSKFTDIKSGRRFALDCLFLVEFDEDGKCSVFSEWWHLKADGFVPGTE